MNQTVLPVAITSSLVNAYQDGTGKKMSAQDIIGYCARISNPDNQSNSENGKLLKYLIDNKHWSPFEMVDMVLEINTTRDIARQILRHRSFSFQEFSQRYQDVNKLEGMFESIELRSQCEDNRQSSSEIIDPSIPLSGGPIKAHKMIENHLLSAHNLYNRLLEAGVAREQARMVLPLATTTKIHMTGSIRSWIHFLELRDDEHAQKEIQLIAKEIKKHFVNKFPVISNALGYV